MTQNSIKVFALGGLGEVGKNMYCIEHNNELIIIDSGILFPDSNYGVDYIIPDYSYLKKNEEKIVGLFITHGHEDHIGGIPYLISQVKIPKIYACGLAIGLIKNKLSQFPSLHTEIVEYNNNSIYTFNNFEVSFFQTNHSIPDSYGIAIKTIYGFILHTGDFKFDLTPIANHTDYAKICEYSSKGVILLLADSTNSLVDSLSLSERSISTNIKTLFSQIKGRIIISTFASNVYRLEQIINASVANNRKVIVFGRSMEKTINVGQQLKYIKAPEGTFITANEFPHLAPNKITILSTGSQGEPLAALSRIADGNHKVIKVIPDDTIIFSSSAIPGNQASINRTINKLYKAGANVIINSSFMGTHTSGHASSMELQMMLCLVKPKFFMPIHGEYTMLHRHAELAQGTGIPKKNCFILENGDVLSISKNKVERKGTVSSGAVFIDGNNSIVDNTIIRERKMLSEDGMISITFVLNKGGKLVSNPEIISRGFIYMKNSEVLINDIQKRSIKIYNDYITTHKNFIQESFKKIINQEISNYIFELTERKPLIIPVILEA